MTSNAWVELTPAGVLEHWPPPAAMTDGLNLTDAQRAIEAYAHNCIDVLKQVHSYHGHTSAEESEMVCQTVGKAIAQLIADGTLRGELH
ncbi:hypothetical protein MRB56_14205 [Halomonas cupida]|uniref:hypothetical protein n=1 Tax=Halomonas cupida TaxID=44933 RepID=UPI0039B38747